MPTSTKPETYKSKTRGKGEPIHEFVARQLRDNPPEERGTDPTVKVVGSSPSRRDMRTYFKGTLRFPDGIQIGGAEVYRRAPDGALHFHAFVEDLSIEQMRELETYANGTPYMSQAERRAQRREAIQRRTEIRMHGHATSTAPIEEQVAAALRQMPNATAAQKRRVLEALLEPSEEKSKP
jgi:hypothetical protein